MRVPHHRMALPMVIAIMLLSYCPWPCFAQGAAAGLPVMYSIDYKMTLALHPLMANYDLVLGRHLRGEIAFHDTKVMNEVNARINQLNAAAQPRIKSLQKKFDLLAIERSKVGERMQAMVGQANAERGTFDQVQTNKAQKGKIADLDRQMVEIQAQMQAAQDEVLDPIYLTRAQSKERINQALTEIDHLLANISAQRGGAIIIDRDFVRPTPLQSQQINTAATVGADPLSINLFQKVLTGDLVARIPEVYQKDPELQRYAAQMRAQMATGFDRNVATQMSKAPLYAAIPATGRLFLVGGEQADLTRQVITEIYRQHNVRTEVAQRILAAIKID